MHWQTFQWIAGSILALVWSSRIVQAAIGMPSVADIAKPEWDRDAFSSESPTGAPRVSIIVPARNEGEHIRETIVRLLALDYPNYEIIAVDDRSTDSTGGILNQIASSHSESKTANVSLKVIHVSELPSGWLGKTHAMWTAAGQSTGDWLLFTDADVLFKPDSLRRSIAYAEAEHADHFVLFPRMIMEHPGERMMIAFFQALFVFGHRPWKVADPRARDHMGVGAFNLVRRSAYEAVGTHEKLRLEVVDDMKLGKLTKNAGYRQRVAFGEDLISIHWAKGTLGVMRNLTKNFYALLSFQWWRTIASVIGLGLINLGPFLGIWIAHGWARLPYAVAILALFFIYHGMSHRSSIPSYYVVLHPISTSVFMFTLLRSMFHAIRNDGIIWRDTRYPLDELRKGIV